jgi:hypothetical protein
MSTCSDGFDLVVIWFSRLAVGIMGKWLYEMVILESWPGVVIVEVVKVELVAGMLVVQHGWHSRSNYFPGLRDI